MSPLTNSKRNERAIARNDIVEAAKVWARTKDPRTVPMSEVLDARARLEEAVARLETVERRRD